MHELLQAVSPYVGVSAADIKSHLIDYTTYASVFASMYVTKLLAGVWWRWVRHAKPAAPKAVAAKADENFTALLSHLKDADASWNDKDRTLKAGSLKLVFIHNKDETYTLHSAFCNNYNVTRDLSSDEKEDFAGDAQTALNAVFERDRQYRRASVPRHMSVARLRLVTAPVMAPYEDMDAVRIDAGEGAHPSSFVVDNHRGA